MLGYAVIIKNQKWGVFCMRKKNLFLITVLLMFAGALLMPIMLVAAANPVFDSSGENYSWVITPRFMEAGDFSEGLAPVFNGQNWGFIDRQGTVVFEPVHIDAVLAGFSDDLAIVASRPDVSFIDRNGNSPWPNIVMNKHDAKSFSDGLAAVLVSEMEVNGEWVHFGNSENRGAWGFINRTGNIVVEPQFADAKSFSDGLAAVTVWDADGNTAWGFINHRGEFAIGPRFGGVSSFSDGLAAAIEWAGTQHWGFIDTSGNTVIAPQFYGTHGFSDGLAAVMNADGQWGFIDRQGNIVIAPQFAEVRNFSEGFAAVKYIERAGQSGHWGFIDTSGNMVIRPQFFGARSFSEGVAAVGAEYGMGEQAWGFISMDVVTAPTPAPQTSGISVTLNGSQIQFDVPPTLIDGRTLVPLRAIFETMGATIVWEAETQTVTAVRGDTTVIMQVGSNILNRNGAHITLDVPAQLVDNRTLVPARAVAEAFGANVDWNEDIQTVIITT